MCGYVCTCLCVCTAVHACVYLAPSPLLGGQCPGRWAWWSGGSPALAAVPERGPCGPLCRFSHGQVVSVDELRPFQDPDLSSLQAGSACLAKQPDGLWYPARITGEAALGPHSGPAGGPPLLPRYSPTTTPLVGCWVPIRARRSKTALALARLAPNCSGSAATARPLTWPVCPTPRCGQRLLHSQV